MITLRTYSLALALLTVTLPAQTAAPAANPPHLLIDTVGPDGWRMRLGPTNVGSLLASEKGRDMWRPAIDPYLGLWRQFVGSDEAFTASRELAIGYGGRIRVAAWFGGQRPDVERLAMVLESDGRTDMHAVAAEVRRMQERASGEWTVRDVGGTKIELRVHGDGASTAPILEGSALLIAAGNTAEIGDALAAARSLAHDTTGKPPAPTTPALRVTVDFRPLIAAGGLSQAMVEASGLASLGTTTLTVGTAGPRVALELAQSFVSDDRGVFAALFPATQGMPSLANLHGKDGAWKVGRFDWLALYKAVERILGTEEIGERNVREQIRKEVGIDVVDDLLVHATDEVLLDVAPSEDPERIARTPWSLTVRLVDQTKFKAGLDAMLAKANPTLTRKDTIQHDDCELRRFGNMLGYDVWVAVGRGLFIVAGGSAAEDRLKALLDAAKNGAPAPEAAKMVGFEDLARSLPPGCNGFGRGEVDSIVSVPMSLWLLGAEMRGGMTPDLDPEARERWLELVREHNLDTVRTATGYADRRWTWRLFW